MAEPTLTTSTTTPAIARAAATVLVIVAVVVGLGPASVADAASTEHTYHCTSAVGASDSSYTIDATAPTQVEQGSTFAVDPVVVTGTPPVDLLLADITFGILAPAGATLTSPAEIHFDGPGSTDPPGPIAPAGVPNSSPPMAFSMVATGAVGSTISIYPAPVTSTVVDPDDLTNRLDVSCSETVPTAIAVIEIVAQPSDPTTTASTVAPSDVLAATAAAAQAVTTTPAVTG